MNAASTKAGAMPLRIALIHQARFIAALALLALNPWVVIRAKVRSIYTVVHVTYYFL